MSMTKAKDGWTPLHLAVSHGHLDIVKALLAMEGIDVKVKEDNHQIPLHLAVSNGHLDIVKVLVAT
jgi:ankyrin repeat protein